MNNKFEYPQWSPQPEPGMKILITGASGGLGQSLVKMLINHSDAIIGAHGNDKAPGVHD